MNAVTGSDEIAIGHYCTLAYAFSGWLGSKVGDPKDSTENINLPGWLSMFKDYIVSVSLSIGIIYYIAAIVAGKTAVETLAGGTHWLVWPLMQTLTFTGGLYVIITGVRLFLGEIVPAFVGITEKFIPGANRLWTAGCIPVCTDCDSTRIYLCICGRTDLYVCNGGYENNRYDSGGNSVLLYRRYSRCIRKCARRLEGLRFGSIYYWYFDFCRTS